MCVCGCATVKRHNRLVTFPNRHIYTFPILPTCAHPPHPRLAGEAAGAANGIERNLLPMLHTPAARSTGGQGVAGSSSSHGHCQPTFSIESGARSFTAAVLFCFLHISTQTCTCIYIFCIFPSLPPNSICLPARNPSGSCRRCTIYMPKGGGQAFSRLFSPALFSPAACASTLLLPAPPSSPTSRDLQTVPRVAVAFSPLGSPHREAPQIRLPGHHRTAPPQIDLPATPPPPFPLTACVCHSEKPY